ncbi:glycoside hydrolase family 36 protein [Streptomyces boninensis]|uniref:glycoside hydrolase family 36 protein n=1 Tax=Streptomyces boninensis TaxID=2039455 RepID=UPI003B21780F
MRFSEVAEVDHDTGRARIFEQGWQSWSPSSTYRIGERPARPATDTIQILCYRPETPVPEGSFQGEGLLALDPGDGGPVHVFSTPDPDAIPSIRARPERGRLLVTADGPVRHTTHDGGLDAALATWADTLATQAGIGEIPAAAPMWCSWYGYWDKVTETDIATELDHIDRYGLDAGMILLDDGYEAGIGDWLDIRPGFGDLAATARRITDTGRRAGIWLAPYLVGSGSRLFREHPDWLVGGADAGRMWDQDLAVLDVTHPEAAEYLGHVFRTLAGLGFSHFKLDFIYAGALAGHRHEDAGPVTAYRRGLEIIRDAAGPDATLHGCGAPLIPSLGHVDIMRVGPDTSTAVQPRSGDISQPSQAGAELSSRAREFLHGRWWVNDPDCLIVAPGVEARTDWADFIASSPGLRGSSDRLGDLDAWGLATTKRLLRPSSGEPPR